MLQPKKMKFRKTFKGRIKGDAKGGSALNFGAYGLKALEPERVTARQIEAARRAIQRHLRRQGRLWIRVRSEEHTSELQSLMRISYAVFCLKKKKTQNDNALIMK